MSTSKIETVGMGKSHWSTLRLWRSTSRTEYYGPATAPTQSPDPIVQLTIHTTQPFQMMPGWSQWPGSSPFLTTSIGPPMY
ncbi:hypothetical protein Gotur_024946, partial [Gossypium turneri]